MRAEPGIYIDLSTSNTIVKSGYRSDRIAIYSVVFLVLLGLLMVYSSSSSLSRDTVGDSFYYLKRQFLWTILGTMALLFTTFFDYRWYSKMALPLIIVTGILLTMVYIPGFGVKVGGSVRWVRIFKLCFQPVEVAKLSLVIYLSRFLDKKQGSLENFKVGVLPSLVIVCAFCLLLYGQPDLGSVILILALTFLMLLAGGVKIKHMLLLAIPICLFICYEIWREPYRMKRVLAFLNPWSDPEGGGYHIIQSLLALGSGGLWGVGLGDSMQKLRYLPTPHTDFIFAVIGEEFGFIKAVCIIIAYMLVVWRGIGIALSIRDRFGSMLALGISCQIGLQAIINIATVTGSIPTKGITLPFVSYGGSSLITSMASIGILLNISKHREA